MDDDEANFGSYLGAIAERDVDLLLMEEFHVTGSFVEWFCNQLGFNNAIFRGAWHSVSDSDGETDLLLRVQLANKLIGVLIENKISATETDRQGERYHIRGSRAQHEGKFDEFVTCMCAPSAYLVGLDIGTLYQHKISYEMVADWFAQYSGAREAWKRRVLIQAVAQNRRGYKMAVNPVNTTFHLDYWEYRRRNYPNILMNRPGPKGSKSTWIIMKAAGFSKGVQIHHKLDQCVVELGFDRRTVSEILAIKSDWPKWVVPDQKKGTAVLSINVPEISMSAGVSAQEVQLKEVFSAIEGLIPYANLFNKDQASA